MTDALLWWLNVPVYTDTNGFEQSTEFDLRDFGIDAKR